MTAPALVGLDVGTTRVKAVAYTPDGAPLAVAERATPWLRSPEGVEMDADELTTVVRAVVAEACAGLPRVSGIGVTGMGEAGVLTGPDDARPLAPVRAWHDLRADVETIRIAYGEKEFRSATGMELDPQPSLPKILLLRRERPAAAAARRFWSVPEWAVRCLGGRPGSEWSLASRTGLLDVTAGTAWPGAIDLLGTDLLGELHPAGADCGRATALGISRRTAAFGPDSSQRCAQQRGHIRHAIGSP